MLFTGCLKNARTLAVIEFQRITTAQPGHFYKYLFCECEDRGQAFMAPRLCAILEIILRGPRTASASTIDPGRHSCADRFPAH